MISSSIISGLSQSRPVLRSTHKDMQDNVQYFLIVIQSQALKKGELQAPEMRNPWNQDACCMPGSRNSQVSTKRSGKLHLPPKEMDLCGGSRWHVCARLCFAQFR